MWNPHNLFSRAAALMPSAADAMLHAISAPLYDTMANPERITATRILEGCTIPWNEECFWPYDTSPEESASTPYAFKQGPNDDFIQSLKVKRGRETGDPQYVSVETSRKKAKLAHSSSSPGPVRLCF